MKPYSDARLVQIAKVSGHRAETLTSLIQCSNFKRTHACLMQSFEAFYRFFITLYKEKQHNIGRDITALLQSIVQKFASLSEESVAEFHEYTENAFSSQTDISFSSFTSFMEELSDQQKFWYRFVMEDCFAYIALYVAIYITGMAPQGRYIYSIKLMAPMHISGI